MSNPYVNKVVQSNGTTLIDISDTTAVSADVASGKYFYLATGQKVEGTNSGGGGGSGADGYSPTVTITNITGGHRVTITDVNGTKTFDVMDGAAGATGPKGDKGDTGATGSAGADGFSPTVTVTNITGGHRIAITDATGTQYVNVMDGDGGSTPAESWLTIYDGTVESHSGNIEIATLRDKLFAADETYRVTYDGTLYSITPQLVALEMYCIGNMNLISGTDDGTTGEPFVLYNLGGAGQTARMVGTLRGEDATHTMVIEQLQDGSSDTSEYANPLKGKIAAFTGDSLCYGAGFVGGYARIIGEDNEMTIQNIGVSEGMIVAYRDRFCISQSIPNLREDADYVILEGGLNDAWYGQEVIPLGTLSSGYDATLDTTTFAGAFEYMLKSAIARFPAKKIGYIFPQKVVDNFNAPNSPYRAVAISALEKWGIRYKDFNVEIPPIGQIDALKAMYIAADGLHPNEAAYRVFYAGQLAAWMKTL